MLRRLGSRINQASGPLALFLVLTGGVAYAANTIGSSDIIDNSVASVDLRNNNVRSADVLDGTLGTADVFDNSLRGADVADDSLAGADIANTNSLGTAEVNEGGLNLGGDLGGTVANAQLPGDLQRGTGRELIGHQILDASPGESAELLSLPGLGSLSVSCHAASTTTMGYQLTNQSGVTVQVARQHWIAGNTDPETGSVVLRASVDELPTATGQSVGTADAGQDAVFTLLVTERFPSSDSDFKIARIDMALKVNDANTACRAWAMATIFPG